MAGSDAESEGSFSPALRSQCSHPMPCHHPIPCHGYFIIDYIYTEEEGEGELASGSENGEGDGHSGDEEVQQEVEGVAEDQPMPPDPVGGPRMLVPEVGD